MIKIDNKKTIDTLLVSGMLKEVDANDIKILMDSDVDISRIHKLFRINFGDIEDTTLWECVIETIRLKNRHSFGMEFEDFVKGMIKVYKSREIGFYINRNKGAEIKYNIRYINASCVKRLELYEFGMPLYTKCIVTDKDVIKVGTKMRRGIPSFYIEDEKYSSLNGINGYCVKNGKRKIYKCNNISDYVDMLLDIRRIKYDVCFLPYAKELDYVALANQIGYRDINNKEAIGCYLLCGRIRLTEKVDLEALDDIEYSKLDLRWLFKEGMNIKNLGLDINDISGTVLLIGKLLKDDDLDQEKVDKIKTLLYMYNTILELKSDMYLINKLRAFKNADDLIVNLQKLDVDMMSESSKLKSIVDSLKGDVWLNQFGTPVQGIQDKWIRVRK